MRASTSARYEYPLRLVSTYKTTPGAGACVRACEQWTEAEKPRARAQSPLQSTSRLAPFPALFVRNAHESTTRNPAPPDSALSRPARRARGLTSSQGATAHLGVLPVHKVHDLLLKRRHRAVWAGGGTASTNARMSIGEQQAVAHTPDALRRKSAPRGRCLRLPVRTVRAGSWRIGGAGTDTQASTLFVLAFKIRDVAPARARHARRAPAARGHARGRTHPLADLVKSA